jgi:hypothetical protein
VRSPNVDEWAVSKQLSWTCDANLSAIRMLPAADRLRREEIDRHNRITASSRRLAGNAGDDAMNRPRAGVVKLLQRLHATKARSQPAATHAERRLSTAKHNAAPASGTLVNDSLQLASDEAALLLERKREVCRANRPHRPFCASGLTVLTVVCHVHAAA